MKIVSLFLIMTVSFFSGLKNYLKNNAGESVSPVEIRNMHYGAMKVEDSVLNIGPVEMDRIYSQVTKVRDLVNTDSKYSKRYAFLLDMQVRSGKNRFFIYDLMKDQVVDQGLVAHGVGSETGIAGMLKFSNEPNSYCTSLGRYSIEKPYKGTFGKSYRLIGLDKSNNNALKRAIVLHSYSAVPCEEQQCNISRSLGCPMVNEDFFKRIEKILDKSKSKVILDIYY